MSYCYSSPPQEAEPEISLNILNVEHGTQKGTNRMRGIGIKQGQVVCVMWHNWQVLLGNGLVFLYELSTIWSALLVVDVLIVVVSFFAIVPRV